jgi:hypothetical protein
MAPPISFTTICYRTDLFDGGHLPYHDDEPEADPMSKCDE